MIPPVRRKDAESVATTSTTETFAPAAIAHPRAPTTLVWFPRVYANSEPPADHGNASARSRIAPVAPDVNTTAYSPNGALRCVSVASLASSTSALVRAPASCALCGLPSRVRSIIRSDSRTSDSE